MQHNRIQNPNWQEATSWLFTSVGKDLNLERPRTNPASGESGTRTRDRLIASPTRVLTTGPRCFQSPSSGDSPSWIILRNAVQFLWTLLIEIVFLFFSDSRYQSFRRTLRGRGSHHSRPPLPIDNNRENQTTGETSASSSSETSSLSRPSSAASSTQPSPTPSTSSNPSTPSTSTAPSPSSASSTRASSLNQSPAVKFLIRYDLIDYLKSKGVRSL